jgi:hypothetical protein
VTKRVFPKGSQMRNRNFEQKRRNVTKITQISPGEGLNEELKRTHGEPTGLSEGLRGTHRELRNSGNSDHPLWRTQGGTQGAPPLGIRPVRQECSPRADFNLISMELHLNQDAKI